MINDDRKAWFTVELYEMENEFNFEAVGKNIK